MSRKKDNLEQLKQIAPGKLTMGQRIRLIRGNKNQTEIGKLLNKSQDAVSVYERDAGAIPLDVLSKLAEIGHVTIGWLAYGPAMGSHKNDVVFHGYIIKPNTPEWQILEMMTNLKGKNTKDKVVELVERFISIERK